MSRNAKLILTGLALAAAAPANAAATAQDVRCFILSNLFAQKADKEEGRKLALASGFYYLGKLQGTSDGDLRRTIAEQTRQITQATASREMQACAQAVQASGLRMQQYAPAQAAPAPQRK